MTPAFDGLLLGVTHKRLLSLSAVVGDGDGINGITDFSFAVVVVLAVSVVAAHVALLAGTSFLPFLSLLVVAGSINLVLGDASKRCNAEQLHPYFSSRECCRLAYFLTLNFEENKEKGQYGQLTHNSSSRSSRQQRCR